VLFVVSSDAISADAGYRLPRESKCRGLAIGEYQGALVSAHDICFALIAVLETVI
jgi:hypothetical protein